MNNSAPIVRRAQKRERDKFLPGTVVSFTTLSHPPARFGPRPRMVGLVELQNGRRVLAPLVMDAPYIGQTVRPRMRLSHVTHEGLRVYEVAYDEASQVAVTEAFSRYLLAFTGPSGVGKSTITKMLAHACSDYAAKVPILTTRAPKAGDDGEYLYTTSAEFDRLNKTGEIVAMTEIPSSTEDRRYGYRAADIEAIWDAGKIPVVVTEMDLLQGLAHHYGRRAVLSFGLLPPGKSKRARLSQLLHRLRSRGRESEAHIRDRLKNAEKDLAFFGERKDLFDHMVVNEDLSALVASLKEKVPGLSGA